MLGGRLLALNSSEKVKVSHPVSKLYLPDDLPSRVLAISLKGDLTVLDTDLVFKSTMQSETDSQYVLKSFNFSRQLCSFLPSGALKSGATVVLSIIAVGDELRATIIVIDDEDAIVGLGEHLLPLDKEVTPKVVAGVSCSESGHLSILSMFTCLHHI